MIRDVLTVCALVVSVTGIGVSLAREEMRCYLGLQSSECASTEIQSPSPSSVQKNTRSNPETSSFDSEIEDNNKAVTKTIKPLFSQPEDSNNQSPSTVDSIPNSNPSESTELNPIESVSPVEEVSKSQPLQVQPFVEENNASDTSTTPENSSPTEEKSFGIPIEVKPFPETE